MTLAGKTAVITGSNSGIGLGIARELAKAGANIVLNSFTNDKADHDLAQEIADNMGVQAKYVQADMTKADDCRRLIVASGGCDILVNNAGIQYVAPIEEFPTEKWDAIIAICLTSAFHTTAAAITGMRSKKWGRIVNIASAHGLRAHPDKSAYVSAKHGIVGLTKTVALETAEEAITCNAICPGYVMTPLVDRQIIDLMAKHKIDRRTAERDMILDRQPSKQFATIDQIAGTAAFLCSPAADQITGTTISVDGGWTAS